MLVREEQNVLIVHSVVRASGWCVCAHSSGSDGHVVPVAGWPLGGAVAA